MKGRLSRISYEGEGLGREAGSHGGLIRPASLISLLCLWLILSYAMPRGVLPGPVETAEALARDVRNGAIFVHMRITLARMAGAFLLAMSVGVSVGMAMGLWRRVDSFLDTWLILGMTIPGLVYIVVIYICVGLNELAAVLAASSIVIPSVIITVREGVKSIDQKLVEMALAFNSRRGRVLRRVVLPQILPHIMAAARYGLGLVWKMVLFVEFMGRSSGMGFQIHFFYQLYDMHHVLSYTLFFVGIMMMLEFLVVKGIERRLFKWRSLPAV